MQEAARTGSIDNEVGQELDWLIVPLSAQEHSMFLLGGSGELDFIEEIHAESLRLFDQVMIEVRAIPVGVGDFFVRTCPDQELTLTLRIWFEWPPKLVMIKSETALQATGDMRSFYLPGSPFAQRPHAGQIVVCCDFLQKKVGQRRGRFSYCEPRMFSSLDQ